MEYLSEYYWLSNILLLSLFTVVYILWLRDSDKLIYNRIYLLGSCFFASIVPLIHLEIIPRHVVNVLSTNSSLSPVSTVTAQGQGGIDLVLMTYWSVAGFCILITTYRFLHTWISMRRLHYASMAGTYTGVPMSFLHYKAIPTSASAVVIKHEDYHALAYHSVDRVLVDLLHSMAWFNPFYFIMKYHLQLNHEFSADRYSMQSNNIAPLRYAESLLQYIQAAPPTRLLQPNSFASLIKNRITMLHQSKVTSTATYLLLLPLVGILFCSSTFKTYYVTIPSVEGLIATDTIPDHVTITDTITTFNPETYEETVQVVESRIDESNVLDHIDRQTYSGELITARDTILVFDTETLKESISIVEYTYPLEIKELLDSNMGIPQQVLIDRAMAAMKKQ